MIYKIFKKIGAFMKTLPLIAILCFVIAYVIKIAIIDVTKWIILIIEGKISNSLVTALIITFAVFTIGIFLYLTGITFEFVFGRYPTLLLDKKYHTITEKEKEQITVIIPAYNEEKTIQTAIEAVKPYCHCVIVVDDGSTDQTALVAKNHGAIVVKHKINRGLGQTLKDGIKKAIELNSKIIINFDADMQYKAEDIPNLAYYLLHEDYDVVMGSRFAGTIEEMPLLKRVGNKMYTKLLRFITKVGISDGQTGFRAFTADFAKKIKIRGDYTYTQEMILEAVAVKAKIGEIPIYFAKRVDGKSRLMKNPFHFARKSGLFLLKVLVDLYPLKMYSIFGFLLGTMGLYMSGKEIIEYVITMNFGYPFSFIVGIILVTAAIIIVSFSFLENSIKDSK